MILGHLTCRVAPISDRELPDRPSGRDLRMFEECSLADCTSARTVRYIHTIIGRALRGAVAWDRVPRYVAPAAQPRGTRRPSRRR